jgi:hypothetical protein
MQPAQGFPAGHFQQRLKPSRWTAVATVIPKNMGTSIRHMMVDQNAAVLVHARFAGRIYT